jgi:hypothetical protein
MIKFKKCKNGRNLQVAKPDSGNGKENALDLARLIMQAKTRLV